MLSTSTCRFGGSSPIFSFVIMNKTTKAILALVAVATVISISSCTRTCDIGYEGANCTARVTDKYIGTFSGRETCGAVTDTFTMAITEVAGDVAKIKIYNIHNTNINATGTVLDNGSVALASQSFGTGNISGSVTIDASGKKTVSYLIVADGYPDANCSWVQN